VAIAMGRWIRHLLLDVCPSVVELVCFARHMGMVASEGRIFYNASPFLLRHPFGCHDCAIIELSTASV